MNELAFEKIAETQSTIECLGILRRMIAVEMRAAPARDWTRPQS